MASGNVPTVDCCLTHELKFVNMWQPLTVCQRDVKFVPEARALSPEKGVLAMCVLDVLKIPTL